MKHSKRNKKRPNKAANLTNPELAERFALNKTPYKFQILTQVRSFDLQCRQRCVFLRLFGCMHFPSLSTFTIHPSNFRTIQLSCKTVLLNQGPNFLFGLVTNPSFEDFVRFVHKNPSWCASHAIAEECFCMKFTL